MFRRTTFGLSCSKLKSSGSTHVNNTDIKSGFFVWHRRWGFHTSAHVHADHTCTLTTDINRHSVFLPVGQLLVSLPSDLSVYSGLELGAAPHCPLLGWGSLLQDELRLAWKKPGLLTRGAGAEITSRLWRAAGSRDMKAGQWCPPRGTPGQGRVSGKLMLLLCCLRAGGLLTGAGTGEKSDKSNWKSQ